MYGYDYELAPANESLFLLYFKFLSKVGQKIKEVAGILRTAIENVGKRIKLKKLGFATYDGSAKQIIAEIGSKTEALITECSKAINTMYATYTTLGEDENGNTTYNYKAKHMEKGANVSWTKWDNFQTVFGALFETMHQDADTITNRLNDLKNIPPLSYDTTVEGYKELKRLYDANGDFGREWSQLKTAHQFANDGPIKKALGKIVSMYNVGVSAAKAFANRLSSSNFRNDEGKKYALKADERKQAKDMVKNGGKIKASNDKATYIAKNGRLTADEVRKKIGIGESAMLSELYDMAYEDAMHDLEMRDEYIKAFESVPDAFDEFGI